LCWYQELGAFFDVGEAEPQTIQDTRVHLQGFLLLPEKKLAVVILK
jgi:hypothetical protein